MQTPLTPLELARDEISNAAAVWIEAATKGGEDSAVTRFDAAVAAFEREVRASVNTSAGQAAQDWQPIETAPKDGTPILIYQPDYEDGGELAWQRHTQHNNYDGEDEATDTTSFDDQRYAIGYWRPWGGWGNRNSSHVNPTHWMPLPVLPGASRPSADVAK